MVALPIASAISLLTNACRYAEKSFRKSNNIQCNGESSKLMLNPRNHNMSDITIRLSGNPIAQPRCKATAFGGHAHLYTPTKNGIHAYKAALRIIASAQMIGPPVSGPVRVDCTFVFSRPRSHYRTGKRSEELRDDAPFWHTSKPDIDNCQKSVMDALSGIVFADDKQVCQCDGAKRYPTSSESPHTTIWIHTLEN